MTQMTFFDTPAFTAPTAVVTPPVAAPAVSTPAVPVRAATPRANARSNRNGSLGPSPIDSSPQARAASEDGLHHMGDLARLVILRYQLIAKRREELAARRPK